MEMAIVLPLLLIILFGIIEFALVLYDKAMITNASREGARAGIVFNADSEGHYSPLTEAEIRTVVNTYLGANLISFDGSTTGNTTVPSGICSSSGATLRVNVAYTYNFLVLPNLATSIIGPVKLAAETIMRCEERRSEGVLSWARGPYYHEIRKKISGEL